MSDPFEHFGLSCPQGGKFYICKEANIEFIGCCTTNPCVSKGKCPDDGLRTSSFNADSYSDLAAQTCDSPNGTNIWYTCKFNSPPFIGCCKQNPCASGSCPRADLVPARLSDDVNLRTEFLNPGGSVPTETAKPADNGLGTGAIAGIAVGAVLGTLLIIGALFWWCFWLPKKRKQKQVAKAQNVGGDAAAGGFGTHQQHGVNPQYSPYQDSHASPAQQQYAHTNGMPSPDMYQKHSPHNSQFDRPLSVSTWSDTSTPAYSRQQPQHQYQQMAPVHEMEGTAQVVSELGTGHEYNTRK